MEIKKNIVYIGEFPLPYGGVTVKNEILYHLFEKNNVIKKIDLMECKHKPWKIPFIFFQIINVLINKYDIIYGIGTSERLCILLKLQKLFSGKFDNTLVISMGGVFSNRVLENKYLNKYCRKLKGIWVETEGMKKILDIAGFRNVIVFPNPKSGKESCKPRLRNPNEKLKLLYFSQISEEKGVTDIMKMVQILNDISDLPYSLDFYGHVVDDYKIKFYDFIDKFDNVNYCGIYDSTKKSVYKKLNEYDILLFPTHWDTEGVPGVLVEAKMSGLAIICSNKSFNEEIVDENKGEGFLLKNDYSLELVNFIEKLYADPSLLFHMKKQSFLSKKRYELEEYESLIKSI